MLLRNISSPRTLLAASVFLSLATLSFGAVSITNGDFETVGGNTQDVFGWFDYQTGNGDLQQAVSGNPAQIPSGDNTGDYWLNLVDNSSFGYATGVYQQIGTYDAGVTSYEITFDVGCRVTDSPFNVMNLYLYTGTATGADGSTPADLLSAISYSGAAEDYYTITSPGSGNIATITVTFDVTGAELLDGDLIWIAFASTDDAPGSQQGLIDNVSIAAIPEPGTFAFVAGVFGIAAIACRRKA